jgi:hypothetical protein
MERMEDDWGGGGSGASVTRVDLVQICMITA